MSYLTVLRSGVDPVVSLIAKLTDISGNPLGNKPIKFYYRFSGESKWHYIGTKYTDTSGIAVYELELAYGVYDFRAVFEGDDMYAPSEATVSKFVLEPLFDIADYDAFVTGITSAETHIRANIVNAGSVGGTAIVKVVDSSGRTIAEKKVNIAANSRASVDLIVKLPASEGLYTWSLEVYNAALGKVDSKAKLLVTAISAEAAAQIRRAELEVLHILFKLLRSSQNS